MEHIPPPPPAPKKAPIIILSADQAREILKSEKAIAAKAEHDAFVKEMADQLFDEIMQWIAAISERGDRVCSITHLNGSETKAIIVERLLALGYKFETITSTSSGINTVIEYGGFSW